MGPGFFVCELSEFGVWKDAYALPQLHSRQHSFLWRDKEWLSRGTSARAPSLRSDALRSG